MLNITFNQIRLFEAVARHQSVTQAAKELNISQPAVSSQLKKLSQSMGDPLIEVIGRKVYLTATGKVAYQQFKTLLDDFEALNTHVQASQSAVEGELRLACASASKYFLPFILAEFLKHYPKVTPKLTLLGKAQLITSVLEQQQDLMITNTLLNQPQLITQPLMQQELVVMAPSSHRLATSGKLSLKSLVKQPLILPGRESNVRQAFEQLLASVGISATPFLEVNSYELLKQSVLSGLGIGVASTDVFALEERAGYLVRLSVEGFPLLQPWYYAYNNNSTPTSAMLAFIHFLQQHAIETQPKNRF